MRKMNIKKKEQCLITFCSLQRQKYVEKIAASLSNALNGSSTEPN